MEGVFESKEGDVLVHGDEGNKDEENGSNVCFDFDLFLLVFRDSIKLFFFSYVDGV